MHPSLTRSLGLTLLLLTPTSPVPAQETDADPDPLYKIELLVIHYLSPSGMTAEAWDPTPELSYPEVARFLTNPKQVEGIAREFQGSNETDTQGRLLIATERRNDSMSDPGAETGTETETAVTPYEVLAADQRELEAGANALQRSGRYEILFHEAWIQPLQPKSSAIPIVLDQSGNNGDWPQLQGSVKFYLSRYLHLETNLWLNTSGDYLPGRWWMPAPPLGPPSVLIDGEPLYIARGSESVTNPSEPSTVAARPPVTRNAWPEPAGNSSGGFRAVEPATATATGFDIAPEWQAPWPYRHSVVLNQKRRMRSNEVHYLDHPLIGVIVKLTPPQDLDLDGLASMEEN